MVNTRRNNGSNSRASSASVPKRRRVKRRHTNSARSAPPPKRRRGRPKNCTKKGGKRPGAGRKKSNVERLGKRRVQDRAKELREVVAQDFHYRFLEKAFLQEVKARHGADAEFDIQQILSQDNPGLAKKVRNSFKKVEPQPLTPSECLALFYTANLNKHQWILISSVVNEAAGVKLLKSYGTVQKCKTSCLPEDGLRITETEAKCNLQSLVDHTVQRTFHAYHDGILQKLLHLNAQQPEDTTHEGSNVQGRETDQDGNELADDGAAQISDNVPVATTTEASFLFSYGFDSASGQRAYKMPFKDARNIDRSDQSLFAAALNPLYLTVGQQSTLWSNPFPQSPSNVRTIFFEWEKETADYVKRRLRRAIAGLRPVTVIVNDNHRIIVKPKFILTLIDGKCFNIITNTHSHQCPCCKSGRQAINDDTNLDGEAFRPKGHGLEHGIQPMHGWIKLMEQLINVAINRPVQQAIRRHLPYNANEIRANEKMRIQEELKPYGLRIHQPTQFGFGNSMDGNTARRIFKNPDELARILKIKKWLIKRFHVILCVINCSHFRPKIQEFKAYCRRTYTLYRRRYGYVPLSPSTHKILLHSHEVAEHSGIPLGASGEGGAEAVHRRRKNDRIDHTRKTGKRPQNEDMLVRDLCRSDPLISCLSMQIAGRYRKSRKEAIQDLPAAARDLLDIPEDEDGSDGPDDNPGNDAQPCRVSVRVPRNAVSRRSVRPPQTPRYPDRSEEQVEEETDSADANEVEDDNSSNVNEESQSGADTDEDADADGVDTGSDADEQSDDGNVDGSDGDESGEAESEVDPADETESGDGGVSSDGSDYEGEAGEEDELTSEPESRGEGEPLGGSEDGCGENDENCNESEVEDADGGLNGFDDDNVDDNDLENANEDEFYSEDDAGYDELLDGEWSGGSEIDDDDCSD